VERDRGTELGARAWGRGPIAKLQGTQLEWSTVMEAAGRARDIKKKQCLFCGLHFTGGPSQIRCHLDASLTPRSIRACQPSVEWQDRHAAVVSELRQRMGTALEAKEVADKQEKDKMERRMETAAKHFGIVAPDEVAQAWLKVVIQRALPLDLFDDAAFRAAIIATAKCGKQMYPTVGKAALPGRWKMTNKILPAFDTKLDGRVRGKVMGLAKLTGMVLQSDGWTSVQSRPIVNAIASLPFGLVCVSLSVSINSVSSLVVVSRAYLGPKN